MNCFKSLARSSFTPHGSVSRVCRQSILGKGFRNTFSSALRAKQPLQELRSTSPPETNSHNSTRCNKGALSQSRANLAIVFGAATLAAALTLIPRRKTTVAEEAHDAPDHFRLEEIRKHNRHAEYHWVYRGTRVYDITDFVWVLRIDCERNPVIKADQSAERVTPAAKSFFGPLAAV